jgi:tetratricopeptide (TPR) repeat protein
MIQGRRNTLFPIALFMLTFVASPACAAEEVRLASTASNREPLYDNLGTLHSPITTRNRLAQQYFDQGLRLVYAFNHEEAIRSFEEAARLDPKAAMPHWGTALALGPNINAPMDRDQERRAYEAVQKAKARASQASPRELAYIDALALRYSIASEADRKSLDRTYADAMRKLSQQYPEDSDAATLFAEALMDLRPWDFWTREGKPQPGTQEIVATLEHVLKRNPNHMGACHYYIHAVEASSQPERALSCARRLAGLAPGAGHLVHMPSHIYIRVGMYEEAVRHNMQAVMADRHYLEGRSLSGIYPAAYYPHNIHFLWAVLMMQGRSEEAIRAAQDLVRTVPIETVRAVPELESFLPTPLFTLTRFGQWEEILQQPPPPSDLSYSLAIWHYARGLAFIAKGQLGRAEEALQTVKEIAQTISPERVVGNNSGVTLLRIASHVLAGQLEARSQRMDEAIRHIQEAVRLQDDLRYYEPPDWYYPVRESLGTLLLTADRPKEAEAVFREDLKRTPRNPWSLYGLSQSLRAQNTAGATSVREEFQQAWSRADLEFRPERFEAFLHMDRRS